MTKFHLNKCGKITTTREDDTIFSSNDLEEVRSKQKGCFTRNNNKGRYWG